MGTHSKWESGIGGFRRHNDKVEEIQQVDSEDRWEIKAKPCIRNISILSFLAKKTKGKDTQKKPPVQKRKPHFRMDLPY